KEVALKVVATAALADPAARERFELEANLALDISHRNVLRVFDMDTDAARGVRFYSLERSTGPTLRAWMDARRATQGATLDEARSIARQLLEALRQAHGRAVHGGLRPRAIAVAADDLTIKIDFASMRHAIRGDRGWSLDDAYYLAPEQHQPGARV